MERFLRANSWGCLGVGDGREVYVVPLNYGYEEGKLFFHCALEGRKMDLLRANPEVCFTVATQSGEVREHAQGQPCHVDCDSVICLGRARIVEDFAQRAKVLNAFNRCFAPAAADITDAEIRRCAVVVIDLSEMTGRRERARKATHWRHRF
jgi:nitroimidazol reductase NimA-like FMN-containing flavoprotein (pyridoxamine 5'-phosphate oxidase superfamily)